MIQLISGFILGCGFCLVISLLGKDQDYEIDFTPKKLDKNIKIIKKTNDIDEWIK